MYKSLEKQIMEKEKSDTHQNNIGLYIGIGTSTGISLGVTFGSVFGNIGIGIALGISFGVGIGIILWSVKQKINNNRLTNK